MRQTKQVITIELGLSGQERADAALETDLRRFFADRGYSDPTIDLGLDESGEAGFPHARPVAFFNVLLGRAKEYCKLRRAVDPKYMDGADETDICGIEELDEVGVTIAHRYWDGCGCHGHNEHGTIWIALNDLLGDFEALRARLENEAAEARARAEVAKKAEAERRRLAEEKRKRTLLETLKKELGE